MAELLTAITATAVSGAFAVSLVTRFVRRGRRDLPLAVWGAALVLFAVASAALTAGVADGWTMAEFRTFYLLGGVLNVPWLALGSIIVNARTVAVSRWTGGALALVALLVGRSALVGAEPGLWLPATVLAAAWAAVLLVGRRRVVVAGATAVLVAYSVFAAAVVLTAPTVAALPAAGLPEGRDLFLPAVRGHAVGGNAVGALTVVIGALVSSAALVWRRPDRSADREVLPELRRHGYVDAIARWIHRGRTGQGPALAHLVRGNLMIALGTGLAGAGGILSFLGDTVGHAVGFTAGVTVMFVGFLRTTRPVRTSDGASDDAPRGRARPHVVVLTRKGCGLCRRAEAIVAREARGATVEHVDVDVAGLADRYGVRVPVVTVDGREVAELEVAPGVVRRAVRDARRGATPSRAPA